jgi:hypothetical protein
MTAGLRVMRSTNIVNCTLSMVELVAVQEVFKEKSVLLDPPHYGILSHLFRYQF